MKNLLMKRSIKLLISGRSTRLSNLVIIYFSFNEVVLKLFRGTFPTKLKYKFSFNR